MIRICATIVILLSVVILSASTVHTDDLDRLIYLPLVHHSQAGPCLCDEDRYNCDDFATQGDAQVCFDYCRDLGYDDVHRLDGDGDNVACESLAHGKDPQ